MPAKTRKARAVENLASALMECMDAAAEEAARRTAEEAKEAARRAAEESAKRSEKRVLAAIQPMIEKQNATLRLMWKQMKGNGKLPIDEDGP